MPHELAVSAASSSTSAAEAAGRHADSENLSATSVGAATPASGAAGSSHTTVSNSGTLFANPTMELNANLGIVVIEFRNASGEVTRQIPTQRQINAYLSGSASVPHDSSQNAPAPSLGDAA